MRNSGDFSSGHVKLKTAHEAKRQYLFLHNSPRLSFIAHQIFAAQAFLVCTAEVLTGFSLCDQERPVCAAPTGGSSFRRLAEATRGAVKRWRRGARVPVLGSAEGGAAETVQEHGCGDGTRRERVLWSRDYSGPWKPGHQIIVETGLGCFLKVGVLADLV